MRVLASLLALVAFSSHARAATFSGGIAPVWSADGKEIAYVGPAPYQTFVGQTLADLDNLNHVFLVPADGSAAPHVVATAPKEDTLQAVAVVPGGVVYQDTNYTLWRALAGKPAAKVAIVGLAGGSGVAFTLSPDGSTVAFDAPCGCRLAQADRVETVALAGGRTRRLSRSGALDPSFSPDGKSVVFSGAHGTIVVEPTWGGPARSLGMFGSSPQWSPDGRWIAFLGKGDAFEIVPAAGGTPRTLIAGAIYPKGVRVFSWSPDSSRLVFGTGTTMGTVDLARTVTRFSLPGLRAVADGPPSWSPDGSSIAFTARGNKGDVDLRVYVVDANGQGLRRIA
jgi:Tol biopolymer transport system component